MLLMSTLTLTFDDDFLAQAQAYAQRTGTDLAMLVAELLRPIIAPVRKRRPFSPQVAALAGCISLPPDFDYKTSRGDACGKVFTGEI